MKLKFRIFQKNRDTLVEQSICKSYENILHEIFMVLSTVCMHVNNY